MQPPRIILPICCWYNKSIVVSLSECAWGPAVNLEIQIKYDISLKNMTILYYLAPVLSLVMIRGHKELPREPWVQSWCFCAVLKHLNPNFELNMTYFQQILWFWMIFFVSDADRACIDCMERTRIIFSTAGDCRTRITISSKKWPVFNQYDIEKSCADDRKIPTTNF